ncbi:MAG: hypothetical protein ACP5FN_00960 [Candidatus Micrarchaeia archaeon]
MLEQVTLDKYEKLDKPIEALANLVRVKYVPTFIRLKSEEERLFGYADKLHLLDSEKKTIAIPLQYSKVYIEQYQYPNTRLSSVAKVSAKTQKAVESFRSTVRKITDEALRAISELGISKDESTKLYFGIITKMASIGNENALKALCELEEKGLITYNESKSIDTRSLNIESKVEVLKGVARKHAEFENLDIYAENAVAEAKLREMVIKDYLPIYYELKKYEEEIFEIVKNYNLAESGSVKVRTDYGNVYIGIYKEMGYSKYNAEEIKSVLINYGFSDSDFTAIDISSINRKASADKVYSRAIEILKNMGYAEYSRMRRIEIKAQDHKTGEEKKLLRN